jgi:hypothetical protein
MPLANFILRFTLRQARSGCFRKQRFSMAEARQPWKKQPVLTESHAIHKFFLSVHPLVAKSDHLECRRN